MPTEPRERVYTAVPFRDRVGMSLAPGFESQHKFGRNLDIDATAGEDVWTGGGEYVWPTGAETLDVVSASVEDAAAGSGCATVEVFGLDANYESISEVVALDGQTPVETTKTFLRTFRCICRTPGSTSTTDTNAGIITVTQSVSGIVMLNVIAGVGQTLMAIYTVPLGQTLLMDRLYSSIGRQASAAMEAALVVRPQGECWQTKHVLGGHSQGASQVEAVFDPPQPFTEKTDLRVFSAVSANNCDINAGWDGVLYNDDTFIQGD